MKDYFSKNVANSYIYSIKNPLKFQTLLIPPGKLTG